MSATSPMISELTYLTIQISFNDQNSKILSIADRKLYIKSN
jgi:hypothetical protein